MSVPVSQMWTVATYVLRQKLHGAQALSAGADARAAVPLQSRLRRLRQDPVPGPHPEEAPHRRSSASAAVEECGAPMVSHPRRRAAAASADRPTRRRSWSRAGSTSTSAPTRCCSKEKLEAGCSRRRSTSRSASTWTAAGRARRRGLPRGRLRQGGRGHPRGASRRGFRVTTNTTLFDGADPARGCASSSTR